MGNKREKVVLAMVKIRALERLMLQATKLEIFILLLFGVMIVGFSVRVGGVEP